MKIISHRGNLDGSCDSENSSIAISRALEHGFDVEVDIRVLDGKMYLGHDGPEEETDLRFIDNTNCWVHAKNLDAFHFLTTNYTSCNYFWHQKDDFTLTSNRYIWTYPGKDISDRSIIVALSKGDVEEALEKNPYGLCTDYPIYAKELIFRKETEKRYATYVELCMIENTEIASYDSFCQTLNDRMCEYCMVLDDAPCSCKKNV